jgi:hypothetical protein
MGDATIARHPTPLLDALLAQVDATRPFARQSRTFARLALVTLGSIVTLGRHTLSQVLVALGIGNGDWTAWYRLFSRGRIAFDQAQHALVRSLLADLTPGMPLPVVLDATQLPRSSRHFPGVGWTKAPRSPAWRPGIHLAQRLEILSGLLPRSAAGDSRTVPLRATFLRTAHTQAIGPEPEQTEGRAGIALLAWLRERLTAEHRPDQPVLVVADGAYSTAPVIAHLPQATTLLARCAKNRALFALPCHDPHQRGRKRRYGVRGPTPHASLGRRSGWRRVRVTVRGRVIPLTVTITGPWLIHGAPDHPLMLIVVRGIAHGMGVRRRQREPQYFVVSAQESAPGTWTLPLPLAELLGWAWQRWEVEVMHRELKSSFGLGDQQAWSDRGARDTTAWVLWTYAVLILTGYRCWGLGPAPGPDSGRWWRPRRWSIGRLLQEVRAELWQTVAIAPTWRWSPDTWAEMTGWMTTHTTAALGIRHL